MNDVATNGQAYYSVAPQTDEAWRDMLLRIARQAGISFQFLSYPLPQPLEELWSRKDVSCVFIMCGYPISLRRLNVTPIAAPVPAAPWAERRALYRTDLVVRTDSRYRQLSDTFGGRIGWSRLDSHSGFNALRHHLLQYRTPARPSLYSEVIGNLGSLRKTLDSVLDGTIDMGPLDAYWLALMQRHHPTLAADVRVLESTATAPIPTFVASPSVPQEVVDRLAVNFRSARDEPWFRAIAEVLLLDGFSPVRELSTFDVFRARARQAEEAGYSSPA